jgi:ribosome biogenesis GTPase
MNRILQVSRPFRPFRHPAYVIGERHRFCHGRDADMNLSQLGWNESFAKDFAERSGPSGHPGRVAVQHRGGYELFSEQGVCLADVSGQFRYHALGPAAFPAAGDWVVFERASDQHKAVIQAVLPRRTKLSRNAAGKVTAEQILATNIDVVFVVEALASELNLRRLERSLTLAWESAAEPVVLLTKTDLCADLEGMLALARNSARTAAVLAVSSLEGHGLNDVRRYLSPARTGVLLGPSGVGKSTLINALCADDRQAIQPVRESDGKGRHTTSRRELVLLPGGGLLLDTPGMRELQLWEGAEGLDETFEDIAGLARDCRFADCHHAAEPGCAVLRAVAGGTLEETRLQSFRKLQRELTFSDTRHDARAQAEQRRRNKSIARSLRHHPKYRNRTRT